MPCSRQEYENAREEGARFVFRAAPVAVLGNEQDSVSGLRLVRTELGLPEAAGPRPFLVQPGSEFELPADLIFLALGFDALPCPRSGDLSELAVNEWGGIVVDSNLMTSIPGVFAGGDIVRGPSVLLHAVRDARQAAAQIHTYLSKQRKPAVT
jgi:glutamate synthase (NADPH/NADH) small chain